MARTTRPSENTTPKRVSSSLAITNSPCGTRRARCSTSAPVLSPPTNRELSVRRPLTVISLRFLASSLSRPLSRHARSSSRWRPRFPARPTPSRCSTRSGRWTSARRASKWCIHAPCTISTRPVAIASGPWCESVRGWATSAQPGRDQNGWQGQSRVRSCRCSPAERAASRSR
jgi:hypothetical protein